MTRTSNTKNPDNLYQRGGVWWIRFNSGGKKQRKSLQTRSRKEAMRLRDEILVQRSARAQFGLPMPQKARPMYTFAQVFEMVNKARNADDGLHPNTQMQFRTIARRHLIPAFGPMLMTEIQIEHIEQLLGNWRSRYKRSTVASYFTCLRTIMRTSIKRGWFEGPNPLDRLDRVPTEGPGRDVSMTEEEARALLSELEGPIHFKVAFALYTGVRWGELHGLAWADLNMEADTPTMSIRRSYDGPPKNEASAATVPVSAEVVSLMHRWKQFHGDRSPWVFPGAHGGILRDRRNQDAKAIHAAAARAGIDKHITPHVFRHTFGTWIYERTGDPKTVQRLMRHASFKTSMGYVHDRRNLAPVVNKLPVLTPRPGLKVV